MKNLFFLAFSFIGFLFLSACNVEPEPIVYGNDQCSYCKMNVVDKTHAAQYVTSKGKQFKFDAIECMINDLDGKPEGYVGTVLVADFNNPGNMEDAENATYIISKEIRSPMGANLSAVSSLNEANELKDEHGGKVYNWSSIKEFLSENK